MPANPARITDSQGSVDFGDNVGIEIPISTLLSALTAEASAQGMVVWNGRTTIRLSDVADVDGAPLQFTVTLRAVRTAKDQSEAEQIERAKQDGATRKVAKATDEQNKREAEIMRTATIVRQTLIDANAQRGNLAQQVSDALALANAVASAVPTRKQITE